MHCRQHVRHIGGPSRKIHGWRQTDHRVSALMCKTQCYLKQESDMPEKQPTAKLWIGHLGHVCCLSVLVNPFLL